MTHGEGRSLNFNPDPEDSMVSVKGVFWLTSQIKSEKKRQNGSPTQIFRPFLQSASPPLRKS